MLNKIHMVRQASQQVTDLRTETKKIGDAIKGGKTNYVLTTNNFNYNYGSQKRYIGDGGADMFDNANFTSPISSSTRSDSSPSTSSSEVGHPHSIYYDNDVDKTGFSSGDYVHPDVGNFTYVTGGWSSGGSVNNDGVLIAAGTTGNSGYQWCGWMVGGNSGAEGAGSKDQVDLYSNSSVDGFTVYSSYMSTSGAGSDPSCNSLYILLGHSNWGTVFGTVNKYNQSSTAYFNSAMWSESTNQVNVLAIYLLVARSSAVLPVQSEMKDIVDEVISDIKAEFGY